MLRILLLLFIFICNFSFSLTYQTTFNEKLKEISHSSFFGIVLLKLPEGSSLIERTYFDFVDIKMKYDQIVDIPLIIQLCGYRNSILSAYTVKCDLYTMEGESTDFRNFVI